ncbi:hypothetical protein [Polyangium fumosum]|uniref:Uncharacterized protein n=1 Tax=Polyangium fumosum TaxID=889272 RepID=A0A4U1JK47_9BACT|nr:hypothetical protein [Polyangium fumosum]TKD12369.1 hypothetical protein E8A74_04520 [Polyangium fumosum]
MPYEIFPDGRVRADSADEVFALWSKLKKPVAETSDSKPNIEVFEKPESLVSRPSCIEDSWGILMRMLSEEWLASHRHVLSTLKKLERPLTRDAFREALGPGYRSNNVVGGTLSGISRHARKAGLDLATIVITVGNTYRPGPLLRERPLPWDDAA